MAYKTIMDNLLAEFRAVQKIQAQDAQVIKQLSNEEKARLSLVQKLIKAYLAGEPEEVVLGLLGGNGLAKLTATQNGGEIEKLYQKLKILLEVKTIDPNRYKEEAVLAQAKAVMRIEAEDYEAYQKEFAKLDKKAADYERYSVLSIILKEFEYDFVFQLQANAELALIRSEKLPAWLNKAQAFTDFCNEDNYKQLKPFISKNQRFELMPPKIEALADRLAEFDSEALGLEFKQFRFDKIEDSGEVAMSFFKKKAIYGVGGTLNLESVTNKTRAGLKDLRKNPSLPKGDNLEYRILNLPLFKQGEKDADEIDLNDITQGSVADCYALAALGAVAYAQPQLIRDAIQEIKGGYKVRFYVLKEDGSTTEIWVHVDNQLPVKTGSEEPTYAKKGDGELWVMVFEKALAKLAGGYKTLGFGKSEELIFMLTGKVQVVNNLKIPTSEEKKNKDQLKAIKEGHGRIWDTLVKKLSEAGNERLMCTLVSQGKEMFKFPLCEVFEATADNGEPLCVVNCAYVYIGNHVYTVVGYDASQASIEVCNPYGQTLRDTLLYSGFPRDYVNNLSCARFFMRKNEFLQLVSGVTWP